MKFKKIIRVKLRQIRYKYFFYQTKNFKLSLFHLYSRFILYLALKGIFLPGLNKIKQKLPKHALDIFERKILIYEIKASRFSLSRGPICVRKTCENILIFINYNKFMISIIIKVLIAAIIIIIPIAIFIIFRGVLPVPERILYSKPTIKLSQKTDIKTFWPYTEAPFLEQKDNFSNAIKYLRGITITPVLEKNAPLGLSDLSIGYYPSKLNLMRGFLVGESKILNISQQHWALPPNKLKIQYYLLPSKDENIYRCKIQLQDENKNILSTSVIDTPQQDSLTFNYSGLHKIWHEMFRPNNLPIDVQLKEFVINTDKIPKKIVAQVSELNKNNNITDAIEHRDKITNDNCVFALGDFSIESTPKTPVKRRGIIFILVDTLRFATALNKDLMPNLNNFAVQNSTIFLEHRAQANMTMPSIASLMTSRFARELGPIAFSYAADSKLKQDFYAQKIPMLPSIMQNLGYRVGAIGWLSLFSDALEGGVDFGFHNAIISENPAYEARQITEQMGQWLQSYGNAPFFLYLHYNTMHGPYKPPLVDLNLRKFLAKPFGINQKRQLYDALARYFDKEFLHIVQKLKDLGIYDNVDIIITADHGAQFEETPWKNLAGVEQGLSGAYADKGHSLLDEEIKVPLIVHLAHQNKPSKVEFPTGHIDLLPTISSLAGDSANKSKWRGLDLSSMLQAKESLALMQNLSARNTMYFDAHKYAGILFWNKNFNIPAKKYIRQLDKDSVKLYLTHNPWTVDIAWYQPEIFSMVDLHAHKEKFLAKISGLDLQNLRSEYNLHTPMHKLLKIIPKYTGDFTVELKFKITSNKKPIFSFLPIHIQKIDSISKDIIRYKLSGHIDKNEIIAINLNDASLLSIILAKNNTALMCPNGNIIKNNYIAKIFNHNMCSFFIPPDEIIDLNYTQAQGVIVIQQAIADEKIQRFKVDGAGMLLQQALKDWGYAK